MPRPTESIESMFSYHQPSTPDRVAQHNNVRSAFLAFAAQLDALLPPGTEHTVVLHKLQEAMFWSNAAVARQDDVKPAPAPTVQTGRMAHSRRDHGATPSEPATP